MIVVDDRSDTRAIAAERMRAHDREQFLRYIRCDDGYKLAFVGDKQGIEAEQLACGGNLRLHRDCRLLDANADLRLLRDFIQRRGESTARRIPHKPDGWPGDFHHSRHQIMQRGRVGENFGFEREILAP